VLQFAEDLTDRQAAAMAVRAIDWKYALGAELTDTGFDASVLSTNTGEREHEALLLITTRTALRDAFLDATVGLEPPLTAVLAERLVDAGAHTAHVLAASVAAAGRIALENWLQPTGNAGAAGSLGAGGLVVPSGPLPDQLRAALSTLAPAFDAAERHTPP
jgi:hypothetical protein